MHMLLYKKKKNKVTHTMALFRHSQIHITSLLENEFWLYGSTYSIAGMSYLRRVSYVWLHSAGFHFS